MCQVYWVPDSVLGGGSEAWLSLLWHLPVPWCKYSHHGKFQATMSCHWTQSWEETHTTALTSQAGQAHASIPPLLVNSLLASQELDLEEKPGTEASPFSSGKLLIPLRRDFFCFLMPHLAPSGASDLKALGVSQLTASASQYTIPEIWLPIFPSCVRLLKHSLVLYLALYSSWRLVSVSYLSSLLNARFVKAGTLYASCIEQCPSLDTCLLNWWIDQWINSQNIDKETWVAQPQVGSPAMVHSAMVRKSHVAHSADCLRCIWCSHRLY